MEHATLVLLLALCTLPCCDALAPQNVHSSCSVDQSKTLTFNKDGTFKVLLFTDLHYGESDDKDRANDAVSSGRHTKLSKTLIRTS